MDSDNTSSRRRGWRSRWAAIGAAVAVSLGGGGFLIADAASGPESTIVTVDPVRILDTRDPVNVGLSGPFVSAVSQKLQVTGPVPTTSGTQTVVPDGATGVLLNVTSVGATANGFISIRPGDASGPPATSSLNVTAGVTVPNAVTVALPTTGTNAGEIDITWDALGVAGPTTDILIDVVGYTSEAKLAANAIVMASASVEDVDPEPPVDGEKVVATVTIVAPVPGTIQLVGGVAVDNSSTTDERLAWCWMTVGSAPEEKVSFSDRNVTVDKRVNPLSGEGTCSTNGAVQVTAGTHVLNLYAGGEADLQFWQASLDAIFAPGGTVTLTPNP